MNNAIKAQALPGGTKREFHPRNWLAVLNDHMTEWARQDGCSQKAVMWEVVEVFRAQGWDDVLDVEFPATGDLADQQRLAAQKIRRWLQGECQPPGPNFMRELERVIVAAMPTTIRLSYLNEIYSHADVVSLCHAHHATEPASLIQLAASASKECGEAVAAVLNLPSNSTQLERRRAEKELLEAIQACQQALDVIREVGA